jgi:hypothetical protein
MDERRKPRVVAFLLAMLLAASTGIQALASPATLEGARQAAAVTETAAFTLEARASFSGADDKVEAARVLNRIGHLQLVLNDPAAAMEAHQKSLKLLSQSPSDTIKVDSLNGLADAHLRMVKRTKLKKSWTSPSH